MSLVGCHSPSFQYAGTTVTVFLFGEAHQDNFRESEGSVVAIVNAVAGSSKGKDEATLKVTESTSILKLGTSSDFALCGSRKRVRPHAHPVQWLHPVPRLFAEDLSFNVRGPSSWDASAHAGWNQVQEPGKHQQVPLLRPPCSNRV